MNSGTIESNTHSILDESSIRDAAKKQIFWWGDVVAVILVGWSILSVNTLCQSWWVSTDRILFWLLTIAAMIFAGARSKWEGGETRGRTMGVLLFWAFSVGCLIWGLLFQSIFGFACMNFFAVMGWFVGRIRGESPLLGIQIALISAAPAIASLLDEAGFFESLSDVTLVLTSDLTDLLGIPHAKDGASLIFSSGVFNDFGSIGSWDGILTLLGLAIAWTTGWGRTPMSVAFSILAGAAIWIATRSVGFCVLAFLSNLGDTWHAATFFVHAILFSVACICLLLSDYFLFECLKPIPLETDMEAPILAYSFNWISGLPQLKLGVPKMSANYSSWQQQLTLKGEEDNAWTSVKWLLREYRRFFLNPVWTFAGLSDALRGWFYSRKRTVLYLTSPFLFFPTAVLAIGLFSQYGQDSGSAERLTEQSHRLCSTARLEKYCRNLQEGDFRKSIGVGQLNDEQSTPEPINQEDLRYLELLSMRIVDQEPANLVANYRLGLIWSASGNRQKATDKMTEVASGSLGDLPESNEWLAKDLINRRAAGENIDSADILRNIDKGASWNGMDHRLLLGRAKIFADQGRPTEAIELIKVAVKLKPELVLELARFYKDLKHPDFDSTAYTAEAFFLKRIDLPTEQEVDRMSVAEARVLLGQLDLAEEVLQTGLQRGIGGERMKLQLSEVQFRIYLNSIKRLDNGEFSADLSLLEKAAATDSSNPSISAGIAKLLPLKIKPTRELLDVLKKQVASGTISVATHLSLGEGYFAIGRIEAAEEHWELALKGDPNSIVGLNNLAFSLASKQQPNLERALELASRAHAIAPQNPSVLDTYGEILMLSNRPQEAVNKLELAIRYDNARIGSRKKLVSAYLAAGLDDMAHAQSKVIEQIESASNAKETAVLNKSAD